MSAKKSGKKVAVARKSPKDTVTKKASPAGGDKPNQAWLTVRVESAQGSGGSDMAFTAKLWDKEVGFGVGTGQERHRILYDGPYLLPPYSISIGARERDPDSDDEFTDSTIDLAIDLGSLQGSASGMISQKPGIRTTMIPTMTTPTPSLIPTSRPAMPSLVARR